MNAKPKAQKNPESQRLTRDDWLDAAFDAVLEGGIGNARVLTLAAKLGVTRGSFYWHFTNHADLLDALIGRWWLREQALREELDADTTLEPHADLERMLETVLANPGSEQRNLRFEQALRDISRHNVAIAKKLSELDRNRTEFFEAKFRRLIDDPKKAADLGSLFYLAVVGSIQALSRPGNSAKARAYFKDLIFRYVIDANLPALPSAGNGKRVGAQGGGR